MSIRKIYTFIAQIQALHSVNSVVSTASLPVMSANCSVKVIFKEIKWSNHFLFSFQVSDISPVGGKSAPEDCPRESSKVWLHLGLKTIVIRFNSNICSRMQFIDILSTSGKWTPNRWKPSVWWQLQRRAICVHNLHDRRRRSTESVQREYVGDVQKGSNTDWHSRQIVTWNRSESKSRNK